MQKVRTSGNEKRMISNKSAMPKLKYTSCNSCSIRTPTEERESIVSPLHSPQLEKRRLNVYSRGKTGTLRELSSQKQRFVVINNVLLVISAHQTMDSEKNKLIFLSRRALPKQKQKK